MAIPSRQIGWGTEDNLLWQISKQLERLTCVTAGGCGAITTTTTSTVAPTTTTTTTLPVYKVFTALVTQSGIDDPQSVGSGDIIVGATYKIADNTNLDVTNIGAPNNNINTYFIATGTTPALPGVGLCFIYDPGAPVATVLENTIGNIWFTFSDVGRYYCNSILLFTQNKTIPNIGQDPNFDPGGNPVPMCQIKNSSENEILIDCFYIEPDGTGLYTDSMLALGTPIEIRVYN
jgi:hypothetical protein